MTYQGEENLEDGLILEYFLYSAASNYKSTALLHERRNMTELAFFGRDPGFNSFCPSKIMRIRFVCCEIAEYGVKPREGLRMEVRKLSLRVFSVLRGVVTSLYQQKMFVCIENI